MRKAVVIIGFLLLVALVSAGVSIFFSQYQYDSIGNRDATPIAYPENQGAPQPPAFLTSPPNDSGVACSGGHYEPDYLFGIFPLDTMSYKCPEPMVP